MFLSPVQLSRLLSLLLLLVSAEAQLQEPLLGRDSAQLGQPIVLQTESEVDSQDSSVHVTIQQTHEVTEMRSGDKVVATEEEWCHCFPWSARGCQLIQNLLLIFP